MTMGVAAKVAKVRRVVDKEFNGLGERLRKAREKDARSLETLCAAVGISRGYWYEIEGERLRGVILEEVIRKIEEVLDVDLEVQFE